MIPVIVPLYFKGPSQEEGSSYYSLSDVQSYIKLSGLFQSFYPIKSTYKEFLVNDLVGWFSPERK